MQLISVNIAVVQTGSWTGQQGSTGIDKRPSEVPVMAGTFGLDGDTIVDTRHHGGIDRAAYAYASEDAAWWSETLGRAVAPGVFGENLTTEGINITSTPIGERWQIGEATFEVSNPRIPCRVFSNFWGIPNLIRQFVRAARPGAYLSSRNEISAPLGQFLDPLTCYDANFGGFVVTFQLLRVLTEGKVASGDDIILQKPKHGVTVGEAFRALTLEPELLPRLRGATELPHEVMVHVIRRLGKS